MDMPDTTAHGSPVKMYACVSGIKYHYLDWVAFSHWLFFRAPSKKEKKHKTKQREEIMLKNKDMHQDGWIHSSSSKIIKIEY